MKVTATYTDALIGARIKEIRTHSGITQMIFANALNVSFQQVQKYENGTNKVSAKMLKDIADYFQVDINFFFEEIAPKKRLASSGYVNIILRINRYLTQIDDKEKILAIRKIVKFIAEGK